MKTLKLFNGTIGFLKDGKKFKILNINSVEIDENGKVIETYIDVEINNRFQICRTDIQKMKLNDLLKQIDFNRTLKFIEITRRNRHDIFNKRFNK